MRFVHKLSVYLFILLLGLMAAAPWVDGYLFKKDYLILLSFINANSRQIKVELLNYHAGLIRSDATIKIDYHPEKGEGNSKALTYVIKQHILHGPWVFNKTLEKMIFVKALIQNFVYPQQELAFSTVESRESGSPIEIDVLATFPGKFVMQASLPDFTYISSGNTVIEGRDFWGEIDIDAKSSQLGNIGTYFQIDTLDYSGYFRAQEISFNSVSTPQKNGLWKTESTLLVPTIVVRMPDAQATAKGLKVIANFNYEDDKPLKHVRFENMNLDNILIEHSSGKEFYTLNSKDMSGQADINKLSENSWGASLLFHSPQVVWQSDFANIKNNDLTLRLQSTFDENDRTLKVNMDSSCGLFTAESRDDVSYKISTKGETHHADINMLFDAGYNLTQLSRAVMSASPEIDYSVDDKILVRFFDYKGVILITRDAANIYNYSSDSQFSKIDLNSYVLGPVDVNVLLSAIKIADTVVILPQSAIQFTINAKSRAGDSFLFNQKIQWATDSAISFYDPRLLKDLDLHINIQAPIALVNDIFNLGAKVGQASRVDEDEVQQGVDSAKAFFDKEVKLHYVKQEKNRYTYDFLYQKGITTVNGVAVTPASDDLLQTLIRGMTMIDGMMNQ